VRVITRKTCEPLEEDSFRPILHHYDGPKFRLELNVPEVFSFYLYLYLTSYWYPLEEEDNTVTHFLFIGLVSARYFCWTRHFQRNFQGFGCIKGQK